MFKKNTVADWMENEGIGYNEAAAKYKVGQNLTYAEAKDIIRMIAQAMGFMEEHPGQHNDWRRGCDPYRKVIFKYARLIEAKKKRKSNWDNMLWVALDEEDQIACNEISHDYFAYKFTMTKRLKEIYEKVPTGFKMKKCRLGWRF
jgi:hypothetical protein